MLLNCAAKWTPCESPPRTVVRLCCLYFWHLLCILDFLVEISKASHISPDLSEMQLQGAPSTHTSRPPLLSNAQTLKIYVLCLVKCYSLFYLSSFPKSPVKIDWSWGLLERSTRPKINNKYLSWAVEEHRDINCNRQECHQRITLFYCCAVSHHQLCQAALTSIVFTLQLMERHFVLLFYSSFIVCLMPRTALLSVYSQVHLFITVTG